MSDDGEKPLKLVDLESHEGMLHNTEMGQRAHVLRDERKNDASREAAHNLMTIGQFLKENDHSIKHCNYLGSAAVHVYQSEVLGEVFFFSQANTLCGMNEMTASDALADLTKSAMKHYGRKVPTKRSKW